MRRYLHIIAIIVLLAACFQYVGFAADDDLLTKFNYLISFYKDRKYNECIASANALLSSDNTLMEAYKYKALSYFKQKKYELAVGVLQDWLKLNPDNEFALYNSACLYSLLGKENEAAECLKQVMELNVTNKRGIKTDSDFDNINDNIIFKNIMGISVRVGGQVLFFDVIPETINDRTMVPMRGVFEALGAKIEWNGETQTITAVKDETAFTAVVGSNVITINGAESEIDTAPVLKDGRTLVPIRFVSEAFGAEVIWNGNDEIVDILTKAPQGNANYDEVKKQLDKMVVVSAVDGKGVQPYSLKSREGKMLIIAGDKKVLELMNGLSDEQRERYMNEKTQENYENIEGCTLVYTELIYSGKAYYTGAYENNSIKRLVYYENGLKANTIIQDKRNYNYKDYYKE